MLFYFVAFSFYTFFCNRTLLLPQAYIQHIINIPPGVGEPWHYTVSALREIQPQLLKLEGEYKLRLSKRDVQYTQNILNQFISDVHDVEVVPIYKNIIKVESYSVTKNKDWLQARASRWKKKINMKIEENEYFVGRNNARRPLQKWLQPLRWMRPGLSSSDA